MREKKFQELTFADDYMFCRILQKHMDVAKQIVKLATGREVENIAYSSKQYAIDPYASAKSIRFDIYFVVTTKYMILKCKQLNRKISLNVLDII